MITVPQTIVDALNNTSGAVPRARLIVRASRAYSNTMTDLKPSWVADSDSVPAIPHPQDVCYVAGGYDKLLSATEVGGYLKLTANISSTHTFNAATVGAATILLTSACKPALYNDGSTVWVFWLDNVGNIKRGTIDLSKALLTPTPNANCIDNVTDVATSVTDVGALHAISASEVAFIYKKNGGASARLYRFGNVWEVYSWAHQFITVLSLITDPYKTVFSAAAKLNGDYFFFFSNPETGAVNAVKLDSLYRWSDLYDAVPADLTAVSINNAFVANGYIHLACQFIRTGQMALANTRSFILRSRTGKIFSFDRFTLFSRLGYRFLIAQGNGNVYGYASNRVISAPLTRFFTSSLGASSELIVPGSNILKLQGTPTERTGTAQVELSNGNGQYSNHALLRRGNQAVLQIGYETSSGNEYVDYMSCIIVSVEELRANGVNSLSVTMMSEGFWHVNQISFPFYVEIEGKTGIRDNCNDLSGLYSPEKSGVPLRRVVVDFWNSEPYSDGGVSGYNTIVNGGASPTTLNGDHSSGKGVMTQSITDQLGLVYDVQVSDQDVYVDVFGWSRTLKNQDLDNDEIVVRLKIKSASGVIRMQDGTVVTYPRWPRSYFTSSGDYAPGSYPVTYKFALNTNVFTGDEIISVAVFAKAPHTTVIAWERVEIYGGVIGLEMGSENTPWVEDDNYSPGPVIASSSVDSSNYQGAVVSTSLIVGTKYCLELTGGEYRLIGDMGSVKGTALQFANAAGDTYNGYGAPWEGTIGYSVESNEMRNIMPTFGLYSEINELKYGRLYFTAETDTLRIRVQEDVTTSQASDWADNSGSITVTLRKVLEDTSKLRLPGWDRPYVMFASKPYSAFNFSLYGKFFYTSGPMPTNKPVRWGLVGFATNGMNYIVARYNPKTHMFELVKVRNGNETILASANFVYDDLLSSETAMAFDHRNGVFTIRAHQYGSYYSSPIVTYTWKESDGPLCEDGDIYHVGIYGEKQALWYYVNSYSEAGSDGVIFLHGSPFDYDPDLPTSGYIKMGEITYKYDGIAYFNGVPPTRNMYLWGPFHCRQTNTLSGNRLAWEITMFDWLRGGSDFAGVFVGSDNGFTRELMDSEWRVVQDPNDTHAPDGDQFLRNRSRHFNPNLPPNDAGFENRMYIGWGIYITEVYSGKGGTTHGHRTRAQLNATDEIWLTDFAAVSGGQDHTITDLINTLSEFSGTSAEFPGDIEIPVLNVSGKTVIQ